MAEPLRSGFGAIHECEDHFFSPHFTEYGVEEIEQPEDHDTLVVEVYGSVEVVTCCTDISRTVLQGAVDSKVMDDAERSDHYAISALFYAFEMSNAT